MFKRIINAYAPSFKSSEFKYALHEILSITLFFLCINISFCVGAAGSSDAGASSGAPPETDLNPCGVIVGEVKAGKEASEGTASGGGEANGGGAANGGIRGEVSGGGEARGEANEGAREAG